MVAELAYLQIVEQLVPTAGDDSCAANLLAATGRARAWGGHLHSANAKSTDPDECVVGQRGWMGLHAHGWDAGLGGEVRDRRSCG